MSIELLLVVDSLLKDETLGLRAKTEALAAQLQALYPEFAPSPGPFRADFNFVPWAESGQGAPATFGNVMMRPNSGSVNDRYSSSAGRDSLARIDIGYEIVSASSVDRGLQAALVWGALVKVMFDELRAYSDARDGTVIQVENPADYRYGEFEGATSYGFIGTFTISERSTLI